MKSSTKRHGFSRQLTFGFGFDGRVGRSLFVDLGHAPSCGFVLITVFVALFILKLDFIVHGIMIRDDLYFFPRVIMEGWTKHQGTIPIASWFYRITAELSPPPPHLSISRQILAYLAMTAMTATFVYLWLSRYFASNLVLITGILLSFTSPAITSMGNFVSGSHGMIGFMFASLGLLFSSRSMAVETHVAGRIALATAAGVSFVLSSLSSPYFYLFALSSVYIIIPCGRNLSGRMIWILAVIILSPSCAAILYNLTWNRYHYDSGLQLGLTDYSFLHMLERSWNYILSLLAPYGQGLPELWLAGAVWSLCMILWWIVANSARPPTQKKAEELRMRPTHILALLSGLVLSSIPILPTTVNLAPRYLFPPMVIAILLLFAIVDWVGRSHSMRFHLAKQGSIIVLFICTLLYYNISITHSFQNEKYMETIRYQPMLANFIREMSIDWPQGAQIVIASEVPTTFVGGVNHWSTGFLRTITGDKTVIGLIGREDWMDEDPFVEFYKHNHEQYWKLNAKGRSIRRRMFGLVKSRPTYAYRFDAFNGTAQRVHWLLVNALDDWDLYRVTSEGIILHESGTDTPADLDRLGIVETDLFVFRAAP